MLATKIALRHPGDRTLLSDLKATYAWLNQNAEDARKALEHAVDIPLFLNVVDPLTSEWNGNWEPASKLVLNLTEDCGDLKAAKPFLRDYEQLLLSAGCHKLLNPLIPTNLQPSTGFSVDLAKQFSEMRQEGRLTDLFFEPIIQAADDESLDNQELAAHKVLLVATLPYFRDKFEVEERGPLEDCIELLSTATESWNIFANDHEIDLTTILKKLRETTPPDKFKLRTQKFKFEGTRFAAKAVLGKSHYFPHLHSSYDSYSFEWLDFIYTGNFEYPAPDTSTQMTELLNDFLGLLSIAEEWNMPTLKTKLTREIVQLIKHLPWEFPNCQFLYLWNHIRKYPDIFSTFYSAQSCRDVPC